MEAKGGLTQLELFELLKNNSNHPGGEQALYTWVKKHFREADIDKNGKVAKWRLKALFLYAI